MWPFKSQPSPDETKPVTADYYASTLVGAGTGLKIHLAQLRNESLRHCRIGKIVLKRA